MYNLYSVDIRSTKEKFYNDHLVEGVCVGNALQQ